MQKEYSSNGRKSPKHFTREHQRMARKAVSSESCSRNGRLGALATIRKHGFEKFFEAWRAWKLEHPSKPELLLIGILARVKVVFEREWRIQPSYLTLDFYFPGLCKAIEFHGRIHGQLKQQQREACDTKKRELLQQQGIQCLWIDHTEMDDVPALIHKIQNFVGEVNNNA